MKSYQPSQQWVSIKKFMTRLTDEVGDTRTPAEELRIREYDFFPVGVLGATYAGQHNGIIIPLCPWSVIPRPVWAHVRHLTQKPALEVHLDNNRNATAKVGRISRGTDAPITSPVRV